MSASSHSLPVLYDWSDPTKIKRTMRLVAPATPGQLQAYVRKVLGFDMPSRPAAAGNNAPLEYLAHAFFEDQLGPGGGRDCVVWANRGGGKTQIGAIATFLDMLFKPGIQIRILGGSFDQSAKMYRYLKRMLETDVFSDLIAGNLTADHVELINGSRVEVLAQSQCSVRGQRVHKVRCDELELFDPAVWEAAQLVTRSGACGKIFVRGSIEALSTMHKPYGLMQKVVNDAQSGRALFRWNLLDTLQRCEAQRICDTCKLFGECGGYAKEPQAPRGFFRIDDAIQQKGRVGFHAWEAEMLCSRPNRSDSVYPEFDLNVHVFDEPHINDQPAAFSQSMFIAGIDFGFRGAAAMVLARVDDHTGVVSVFDELHRQEHIVMKVIELAARMLESHGLPRALPGSLNRGWLGADPAGHARSEQSGVSTISLWKKAGWTVRARASEIDWGVRAVRARLLRADGSVALRIHKRCHKLIEAMTIYRYPDDPASLKPLKDGCSDHIADALRYMIFNLDRAEWNLQGRLY